jgi:hypothetical protein
MVIFRVERGLRTHTALAGSRQGAASSVTEYALSARLRGAALAGPRVRAHNAALPAFAKGAAICSDLPLRGQPTLQLLPPAKGLLRNPHPPDHFRNRCPRLCLLYRIGNLLVCKSTLLHGMFLRNQCYITGKLSLKMEEESGRTSIVQRRQSRFWPNPRQKFSAEIWACS